MSAVATTTIPSSSNIVGGLAGIVAAVGVGLLTKAGYLALAATAVGVPEATMAVVATGVIGMAVNVGVTHIAELKNADDIVKEIQANIPNTYSSPTDYPNAPNQNPSKSNLVSGGE